MSTYPFTEVEEKQRAAWAELPPAPKPSDSPKHLIFSFPIPVGVGDFSYSSLRRFVLADVHARLQGLQGSAVRFGATWNGFAPGVEACARLAQAAPLDLVEREREVFSKLLGDLAISLDPGAEIDLHHPERCRWTQWLFLQLQKHKLVSWRRSRLSDPATEPGRGPAGERPRAHERRTGSWRLDLGAFGDRLLNDLDRTNWPISEKKDQRHLIGRRRGCEVLFQISHAFRMEVEELPVFTTQVEAIYGATFILIHPDHPLLPAVLDPSYEEDLARYRDRLAKGTEPRISGARTGGFALNPANLKRIPVLVSALAKDPFLGGAAMGIPAHDPDQFELAKRLCLSIREAIRGPGSRYDVKGALKEAYTGDGTLTNSSIFSGLPVRVARERIIGYLGRRGIAQRVTRFRLQDVPLGVPGLWGIPVPMLHCPRCGEVTVPEESLPITLPTGPLPPAAGAPPAGAAGSSRALLRGLKEDERGTPAAALDAPDLRMLPGYSRTVCPICSGPAERDPQLLAPWVSEALACFQTVLSVPVPVPVSSPPGAVCSPPGAVSSPPGPPEGAVALSPPQVSRPHGEGAERLPAVPPTGATRFPAGPEGGMGMPSPPTHAEGAGLSPALPPEVRPGPHPSGTEEAPVPGAGEWPVGAEREGPARRAVSGAGAFPESHRPGAPAGQAAWTNGDFESPVGAGPRSPEEPAASPEEIFPEDRELFPEGPPPESRGNRGGRGGVSGYRSAREDDAGFEPARPSKEDSRRAKSGDEPAEAVAGADGVEDDDDDDDDDGDEAAALPVVVESRFHPFRNEEVRRWLPVDAAFARPGEKALFLLCSRSIAKFLNGIGEIEVPEPYLRYLRAGEVQAVRRASPQSGDRQAAAGRKPGRAAAPREVPAPREAMERYGADALRVALIGLTAPHRRGSLDASLLWGARRFLDRVWRQVTLRIERGKFVSRAVLEAKHRLIYNTTQRLRRFKFHTALSGLYEFLDFLESPSTTPEEMDRSALRTFLIVLWPFAPHLADDLWSRLGQEGSIRTAAWPEANRELLKSLEKEIPVRIEGRLCAKIKVQAGLEKEKLEGLALRDERIQEALAGRPVGRVIAVVDRVVNILIEVPAPAPGTEAGTSGQPDQAGPTAPAKPAGPPPPLGATG